MAGLRNSFPIIDLETAYDNIHKAYERAGKGPFRRKELSVALDYSENSGRANNIIGSFSHYGLIKRTDVLYRLTPLALQLLGCRNDNEWTAFSTQAVMKPVLFKKLFTRFKQDLPTNIRSILATEYSVPENRIDLVISNYNKSWTFVKEGGRMLDETIPSDILVFESEEHETDGDVIDEPTPNSRSLAEDKVVFIDFGNGIPVPVSKHLILDAYLKDLQKIRENYSK